MIALLLALSAPQPSCRPAECASIERRKCGPHGTVDWDDNPRFPPPHCNRNGWNPRKHRYQGETR